MFGDKLIWPYSENLLDKNSVIMTVPEEFMKEQGYGKVEKVESEEREHISGGRMGSENSINKSYSFKELGPSKISFAPFSQMNNKINLSEIYDNSGGRSEINTVRYKLVKPFGQDSEKTSYFRGNRIGDNVSNLASFGQTILEIYRGIKK